MMASKTSVRNRIETSYSWSSYHTTNSDVVSKLSFVDLVLLVVGGVIGGGAFSLPQNCSESASPGAILIGWVISGFGIFSLVMVFFNLSTRRPDIECGIIGYAYEGFGETIAFLTAFVYWVCNLLGNCTFAVLVFSSLSYIFPSFGDGTNFPSFVGASLVIWFYHFLILQGVKQVAALANFLTILKVVPLVFFIGVVSYNFDKNVFLMDFWGHDLKDVTGDTIGITKQVSSLLLVTLWVFSGIESASVLSGNAEHPADVGRSILAGFTIILSIFVSISVLSLGILPQEELAQLRDPSVAGVLSHIVGQWGGTLISLTLVISIMGALLTWSLVAAEVPFRAAEQGYMPSFFLNVNIHDVPYHSLWVSSMVVQTLLFVIHQWDLSYLELAKISSCSTIGPYLITAAYSIKLCVTGETYFVSENDGELISLVKRNVAANKHSSNAVRYRDMFFASIAFVFAIAMLVAAGLEKVILVIGCYAFALAVKLLLWYYTCT